MSDAGRVAMGDKFGAHRVLEPAGALPQAAAKLDADTTKRFANEILVDVETLNVDAASFKQIEDSVGGDEAKIGETILATVRARGKQHNPVTGSGGMLLGRVAYVGEALLGKTAAKVGDRIATLVSLTLTPLTLRKIVRVHKDATQVEVEGQAILFESGIYAVLPSDMPDRLALAALDVAGAAPQVARLCKPGDTVLISGAGGKSGILCAYEARRAVGRSGRVVGIESFPRAAEELRALGLCDAIVACDARNPLAVRTTALAANDGREFDRAISCVSVPDAEMGLILATRDRGQIYFFSMTTSFTRAALGAEGVGKDVDMLIGNGYAHDHAEHTLRILRESAAIRELFTRRYA